MEIRIQANLSSSSVSPAVSSAVQVHTRARRLRLIAEESTAMAVLFRRIVPQHAAIRFRSEVSRSSAAASWVSHSVLVPVQSTQVVPLTTSRICLDADQKVFDSSKSHIWCGHVVPPCVNILKHIYNEI